MNNIFVEETFKEQYPDYKEILKLLPLGLISVSRTPLVDEIKLEYRPEIFLLPVLFGKINWLCLMSSIKC